MTMLDKLLERRMKLIQVKTELNAGASLNTDAGMQYVSCLAMLAMTEMEIEQLQEKENGRTAMRP